MLNINFKKLGPIINQNHALGLEGDITVLTGPNKTGKTLAIYLLYGVLKSFQNDFVKPLSNSFFLPFSSLQHQDKLHIKSGLVFEIKTEDLKLILSDFSQLNSIINKKESDYSFEKEIFDSENVFHEVKVTSSFDKLFFDTFHKDKTYHVSNEIKFRVNDDGLEISLEKISPKALVIEQLFDFIYSNIIKKYIDIFFLPAERSTLSYFYLPIIGNTFKVAFGRGQLKKYFNIARPVLDYLDFLLYYEEDIISLDDKGIQSELSNKIAKTRFEFSDEKKFTYREIDSDNAIDNHLVSFNAKSLMGLYHKVRTYDLNDKTPKYLFIDEPESHLHPDSQILLARWLCKLPKYGIKLVLSTHSDYIIREMNNMILLNSITDKKKKNRIMKKYKIDEQSLLTPDSIAPYFFNDGAVELLDVEDEGFAVPTIDKQLSETESFINDLYAARF